MIQFNWKPNNTPATHDRLDVGLELGGDDATLPAVSDGRIKLVEVAAPASEGRGAAGPAEAAADRLIATFHGKIHRNAASSVATRLTFEIFVGPGTAQAHSQDVLGFDPECIFGVDAFVFTFVNREFVVWFPFHVDTRSEGRFLEIRAVAEVDSGGASKEIGRSMVLNLGIHRTHAVDTTSNLPSGAALTYTGDLVGNIILFHEAYLLPGGVRNAAQSTPDSIVLDPAMIPVPASGTQVAFQAYVNGSMHIVLLIDLLDDLAPPLSFFTSNITGVPNPTQAQKDTIARFKANLPNAIRDIFLDAGFAGADVHWSDDPAAAALVTSFTGAFIRQTMGGSLWRLRNRSTPLVTSFWNFFVGSSTVNQTAGSGETMASVPTARTVGGHNVFLTNSVPIGGGTKSLSKPIEIVSSVFQDLLRTRSGLPRTYKSVADYNDAVDKVAGKLVVLIAHEVGHSLGLMHHCLVLNGSNYSEQFGSPVLSLMSSGVESGGFGIGLRFHSQAKAIWAAAFGVHPTFSDSIFQNKTWTQAEVFTLSWTDRTNKFIRLHGEESIARPGLGTTLGTNPPFTTDPPAAPQRGTFS
jgi:hypothetical protein